MAFHVAYGSAGAGAVMMRGDLGILQEHWRTVRRGRDFVGSAVGCRLRYGQLRLAYPIGSVMLNMDHFGPRFVQGKPTLASQGPSLDFGGSALVKQLAVSKVWPL